MLPDRPVPPRTVVAVNPGQTLELTVNGQPVTVTDENSSLLTVLREQLGERSPKDGCAPQGQCGCCTVLVDGSPRVACVTPVRRVRGREIVTADHLPDAGNWADALVATGGSQCGFCTPGIVVRLSALHEREPEADHHAVERALLAHLCRCTGWQTILEAWDHYGTPAEARDLAAARARAELEAGMEQRVAPEVCLGDGGFADDSAPSDALVAVLDPDGRWTLADSVDAARAASGKVQGRRTTERAGPPIEVPEDSGEAWAVTLQTSWVEPAYLETDASWCRPGGTGASAAGNGGAFGGKIDSPTVAAAERLATEHGVPVRTLFSREDTVRQGPKRPPIAAGVRADGSGVVRVARTPGIAAAITRAAPGLVVEEVDVAGPPTSTALRAAGWAEAIALVQAAAGTTAPVTQPGGGRASATVTDTGALRVVVEAGDPLDEVVLRSYCIGAAHQAASWVTAESLHVDATGTPHDLTIRSFGVLRAVDTPPIQIEIVPGDGPAVPVSDAVFAAVAAAVWLHQGCPATWPTGLGLR